MHNAMVGKLNSETSQHLILTCKNELPQNHSQLILFNIPTYIFYSNVCAQCAYTLIYLLLLLLFVFCVLKILCDLYLLNSFYIIRSLTFSNKLLLSINYMTIQHNSNILFSASLIFLRGNY